MTLNEWRLKSVVPNSACDSRIIVVKIMCYMLYVCTCESCSS